MNNEIVLFFLDILIVIMLSVTIFYAFKLSRRLKTVRDSRKELEVLIAQFNQATEQANASILALREVSDSAGKDLQGKIDSAKELHGEIDYIVGRADALADRLSAAVTGKATPAPAPTQKPAARKSGAASQKDDKDKSKDLAEALKDLEEKADEWEKDAAEEASAGDSKEGKKLKSAMKGMR